ncbi:MAG: hypothetical protein AAF763_03035 [Pseudomonadota bacterium]
MTGAQTPGAPKIAARIAPKITLQIVPSAAVRADRGEILSRIPAQPVMKARPGRPEDRGVAGAEPGGVFRDALEAPEGPPARRRLPG